MSIFDRFSIKKISLTLSLLLIGGAFFRLINLGHIIFYWDEPLHQIRIAFQPFSYVASYNDGSSFFAILVHLLLPLGKMEVMGRIASALFGILAIAVVYFLGKRFISRRAGLIASALVAFSPILIQYSQHSRMYASYVFFSLLSVYFFYRAVTEDRLKLWVLFSIATLFNIYNHTFGTLVLPSFGFFTLFLWIQEGFKGRGKVPQPFHPRKPLKFALWAGLGVAAAGLLLLPDKNIQVFIGSMFERAAGITGEGAFHLNMVPDFLKEQFLAATPVFHLVFLGLAFLGFLVSLKKHSKECVFTIFYLILPLFIFVLIRPNEAAALSAYRYFLFFLPLMFIFIGQAVIVLTGFLTRRIRITKKWSVIAQNALIVLIVLFLVGRGFNLKGYISEYWHLGATKIDGEVRDYLESNLKRDSFVFIDRFPATSLILAMNPMTRNLRNNEVEIIIRDNLLVEEDRNPVMFLNVLPDLLKYWAPDRMDFWVFTPRKDDKEAILSSKIKSLPQARMILLDNNILIHFPRGQTPLHSKWQQALDLLRQAKPSPGKIKDYHYISARNSLFSGDFDGFRQVRIPFTG
ncbi:glycosyltransferase family 39 protein, partial [Acidobacteriota bacterium]